MIRGVSSIHKRGALYHFFPPLALPLPPFPLLLPPPYFLPPSLHPLPLEVGPILWLGGLGERLSSPSERVRVEPGRQTVFGAF